jgi:hypothetical protein
MEEVAKMFGKELKDKFHITYTDNKDWEVDEKGFSLLLSDKIYWFDVKGLMWAFEGDTLHPEFNDDDADLLQDLLTGQAEIVEDEK